MSYKCFQQEKGVIESAIIVRTNRKMLTTLSKGLIELTSLKIVFGLKNGIQSYAKLAIITCALLENSEYP